MSKKLKKYLKRTFFTVCTIIGLGIFLPMEKANEVFEFKRNVEEFMAEDSISITALDFDMNFHAFKLNNMPALKDYKDPSGFSKKVDALYVKLRLDNETSKMSVKNLLVCKLNKGKTECPEFIASYIDSDKYNPEEQFNKIMDVEKQQEEVEVKFLSLIAHEYLGQSIVVSWMDSEGERHYSEPVLVPTEPFGRVQYFPEALASL